MRFAVLISLICLSLCPVMAQTSFTVLRDSLISSGNRAYDRSDRRGIRLYADSLGLLLDEFGYPDNKRDSLEGRAAWWKLEGDWHYENSNYDERSYAVADSCFEKAMTIYRSYSYFDAYSYCAPLIHREKAQLYYKEGRYDNAVEQIDSALLWYKLREEDGMLVGKGYQEYLEICTQKAICAARLGDEEALSTIDEVLNKIEGEGTRRETLRKKAKIITLLGRDREEALDLYKEYFEWAKEDTKAKLASMDSTGREGYWMRMQPFIADAYQTEAADPAFLYDITLFGKGLLLELGRMGGDVSSLGYTHKDIGKRLPKDACAIEFVQYEKDGGQLMAALVLDGSGSVKWVPMPSPEAVLSHRVGGLSCKACLESTSGLRKNELYADSTLVAMIWNEGLVEAVKDCERIYFAPDGYLHCIAIEYMSAKGLEGTRMYRLTSTRRLMESRSMRTDSALLMGGMKYGALPDEVSATGRDAVVHVTGLSFNYLPGTLREVNDVYNARNSVGDTLLTGSAASEAAFASLSASYPVIMLSTHGYFSSTMPVGTDLKPCQSDDLLSQSVLAMAGANVSDGGDGLLSALELSRMNLSGVDLAVLSACQTGVGYVTSDGVYGIQRGLKNAGVGSMLVSLWNVDDEATCKLMTEFHKGLAEGLTAHDALGEARLALRSIVASKTEWKFDPGRLAGVPVAVKDECLWNEPRYTDAFILIDAIE